MRWPATTTTFDVPGGIPDASATGRNSPITTRTFPAVLNHREGGRQTFIRPRHGWGPEGGTLHERGTGEDRRPVQDFRRVPDASRGGGHDDARADVGGGAPGGPE